MLADLFAKFGDGWGMGRALARAVEWGGVCKGEVVMFRGAYSMLALGVEDEVPLKPRINHRALSCLSCVATMATAAVAEPGKDSSILFTSHGIYPAIQILIY
jgi:hypothetical protein